MHRYLLTKKNKSTFLGQSLFEVIIALGIVALVLLGIVSLATVTVRNSTFSNNNALATKYTQEALEWIRQERDEDWGNFLANSSDPGTTWCLRDLTWPLSQGSCQFAPGGGPLYANPLFYREATLYNFISVGDPNTVDVAVEVNWTDSQGNHIVRSSTRFTNWNR